MADFDSAVRWARLDPLKTPARRADTQLPFVGEESLAGGALLLDTCVYIDQLQELLHTVGVLDPRDRRTSPAVAAIRALVRSIAPHRMVVPDSDTLGRAALLAGVLCRLQGYGVERKLRALHDCVVFLQAYGLGLTVLSANVADFDPLLQLIPSGRVLLYRQSRA